jgi:Brp/Blh family beta-carotene 15,15'-monooxygenase
MTNKIFSISILVILPFFIPAQAIGMDTINIISLGLILLLGIPHGAIDNILFLENNNTRPLYFYAAYLTAIAMNGVIWFIAPVLSMLGFLLLSAYHFGQSQLGQYRLHQRIAAPLIQLSWGLTVILTFVFFNRSELLSWIQLYNDLTPFKGMLMAESFGIVLLIFATISVTGLLLLRRLSNLDSRALAEEFAVLTGIWIVAYVLPFLPGFALFFVLVHALRVMQDEYRHFYDSLNWPNLKGFILKLLPLTSISLLGIALLFAGIEIKLIDVSYPLLMIVLISSITLPHAYVMEHFYKRLSR